jgi:hypothetical protein
MGSMEAEWRGNSSGRARAQPYLHENKNESLRPQPLGCRKTIIIRRETECVQTKRTFGVATVLSSSPFRRILRESLAPYAVKSLKAFDAKKANDFREVRKESVLRIALPVFRVERHASALVDSTSTKTE